MSPIYLLRQARTSHHSQAPKNTTYSFIRNGGVPACLINFLEKIVQEDAPFVFLYNPELKTSFIPNLPNVFDSGKICTGENFTNVGDSTQELIAVNQHELENSNCNNDLRMMTDLEAKYVRFDRHGNTLDIDEPDAPTGPKGNRFFLEPRLEPILEYTQWMINTNR